MVGPNLLMTNRHVAALFTVGLGGRNLPVHGGRRRNRLQARSDLARGRPLRHLEVRGVVMIHPYWDMALLTGRGPPRALTAALRLSIHRPEDLVNRDVVVVGYPALDPRNDIPLQNQIFEGKYEVKRLQPGKLRKRDSIRSFENTVTRATHDSSTLGGNSGSAVIDVTTGEVVALHFAGQYLKANYCVPTYELAATRASSMRGSTSPAEWRPPAISTRPGHGIEEESTPRPCAAASTPRPCTPRGDARTWTIPVHVTVSSRLAELWPGRRQCIDGGRRSPGGRRSRRRCRCR